MKEFNQIFYGKTQPVNRAPPKEPLNQQVQPHGMQLINFTLTEHLLQEKISQAAEDAVAQTEKKINSEIAKKTKDLKKHMDQQFKRSQITMAGMKDEIDNANVSMIRQSQDMQQMMYNSASPERSMTAQKVSDIAIPVEIDGQQFLLELNDIQGMEIVDLDDLEVEEPQLNKDQYENILD